MIELSLFTSCYCNLSFQLLTSIAQTTASNAQPLWYTGSEIDQTHAQIAREMADGGQL